MIKVIYGPKGTGKTKQIIDEANKDVTEAKGNLVFITDTKRYMFDLSRDVRFVDVSEYNVTGEEALCGFVKGIIAGNHDNEYVFIDGVARIAGKPLAEMGAFFYMLEKVSEKSKLTIYITCSCQKEDLPAFVTKYL